MVETIVGLKKRMEIINLNFYYGNNHALKNINMPLKKLWKAWSN